MKHLLIALALLPLSARADEFANPDGRSSLTVIYNRSAFSDTDATVWSPLSARSNSATGSASRWYWAFSQPLSARITLIHVGYYTFGAAKWPSTAQGWEANQSTNRTVMLGGGVRVYLW